MSSGSRRGRGGRGKKNPQPQILTGDQITFEIEDGTQFIMSTGDVSENIQIIEEGQQGTSSSDGPRVGEEVEVVTMGMEVKEGGAITSSMSNILGKGRGGGGARGSQSQSSSSVGEGNMNMQKLLQRGKTGPALLRNSRRYQTQEYPTTSTASTSLSLQTSPKMASYPVKKEVSAASGIVSNQGVQHAILLDEHGQPTNEVVVLAANENGEYTIVGRTSRSNLDTETVLEIDNSNQEQVGGQMIEQNDQHTIIICQDQEPNQFQTIIDEDGNLVSVESVETFQMEDRNTIYFDESTFDGSTSAFFLPPSDQLQHQTMPSKKKSSHGKRQAQLVIGPDGNPVKKKGQSELKCMEKGCFVTCFNVGELRKHLSISHGFQMDEEIILFENDADFKEWRETYERERMVSFIYRGGTKKVAKDQAVTYLICHRSGHYKPTMNNESLRKRKLKPQGSCKMGGYCTAGIKLIKNTETGVTRMEICHTHYGHPLDSDAIPHLRVTSALRKVILAKFKAGLSFTDVLAYIHHNPDRLEGLRLVDRRAVRNIYDTWKHPHRRSKQVQKDIDELEQEDIEASIARARMEQERFNSSGAQAIEELDNLETSSLIISNVESLGSKTETAVSAESESQDQDPLSMPEESTKEEKPKGKLTRALRAKKQQKNATKASAQQKTDVSETVASTNSSSAETSPSKGSYGLRPNRKVEVYKQTKSKRKSEHKEIKCEAVPSKRGKCAKSSRSEDLPKKKKKAVKKSKQINVKKEPAPLTDSEEDFEEEELPPPPVPLVVSEKLEQAVEKLMNHGDSGPTVLLYKPLGGPVRLGESKRDLKKDDFCVVLQTPVQRQLLLMFPSVMGYETIQSSKPSQKHLKLAFVMVLDEFREPIPVAWLLTNSLDTKILSSFFKALKKECGDLKVKYMMSPKNSEAYKTWCSVFDEKPNSILNDVEVRRDLKQLVWNEFSTDKGRREVWEVVESLIHDRQAENLDISNLEEKFEPLFDKLPHSGEFMPKLEKDWLSRVKEWSYCFRFGIEVNLIGVSIAFNKLRKFVHFKGTNSLDANFEQILKIGYDKCFLRSKRMFKGDQKFSKFLEKIQECHVKGRTLKELPATLTLVSDDTWLVRISETIYCVSYVNSPCECKLVCKFCKICQHMYTCSCSDFVNLNIMCEHVHFVHCERFQILDEPPQEESTAVNEDFEMDMGPSIYAKIDDHDHPEDSSSVNNIEAVLKAAGFGLHSDQIISISDNDTPTVIYETEGEDGEADIILHAQESGHHEIQLVEASDLPDHEVISTVEGES